MTKIRMSDELPDDVGVVFITDVPGFWFQLMGRRAFGELWAGSAIVPKKGQGVPVTEVAEQGIEVVRGPQAEALLKLYDEVHGERLWEQVLTNGGEPAIPRPQH